LAAFYFISILIYKTGLILNRSFEKEKTLKKKKKKRKRIGEKNR
jgi:hypothetical protein